MKAITIWPEWAHCIAHRGQNIINRGQAAPADLIGKRIAIHAGQSIGGRPTKRAHLEGLANMTAEAHRSGARFDVERDELTHNYGTRQSPYNLAHQPYPIRPIVCGAIIATATLDRTRRTRRATDARRLEPWAIDRPGFWWFLSDVKALTEPIPWKGCLGAFELPAEITAWIAWSACEGMPPIDVTDIPPRPTKTAGAGDDEKAGR